MRKAVYVASTPVRQEKVGAGELITVGPGTGIGTARSLKNLRTRSFTSSGALFVESRGWVSPFPMYTP